MRMLVRAEVGALLVEHLDVKLQRSEGERVEREGSLRAVGLAVRFDDLAVHDNARYLDREGSRVQAEPVPTCPGQLAAPPPAERQLPRGSS